LLNSNASTETALNRTSDLELWFVTGSQHLYGPGPLAQVAENSAKIAASLDAETEIPVRVSWSL
jgi:L-arabinose isomerase